jgi:plexin A
MTLLAELIEKLIITKNNPKILLRRNESVAEKMLTNWFAFLLHDFIKDCAGTPLYILFLSIKQQIYKGPVDAITCEARYSLSEDKLIRQSIDYECITVRVQLTNSILLTTNLTTHELTVKLLTCDTITQAKEKILDTFFKGYPFSRRPDLDDLDLIYIPADWNHNNHNNQNRLKLYDEDNSSRNDQEIKRLNTLSHYKITNGSLLIITMTKKSSSVITDSSYSNIDPQSNSNVKNGENMTLLSKSSKGSSSNSPPTYSKIMNSDQTTTTTTTIVSNKIKQQKKCHLIKASDYITNTTPFINDYKSQQQQQHQQHHQSTNNSEIVEKLVSEVYLTRLLATKGGMQSYIDDFFETIFSTAHGSNVLPFAIKYLFDFLDQQALFHGISDSDVVYTWKSNSLPLRFWVNIIKNPEFVFDIHKSNIVDASLSVIASTFMDSCSQSRLDLNKESPSGKLLFYKEVQKYRKWVESYYADIRAMPKIKQQDMNEILMEESKKHSNSFNKQNALYRLYNDYIKKFRVQIENSLLNNNDGDSNNQDSSSSSSSSSSINKHLNYRLQQVIYQYEAIEV